MSYITPRFYAYLKQFPTALSGNLRDELIYRLENLCELTGEKMSNALRAGLKFWLNTDYADFYNLIENFGNVTTPRVTVALQRRFKQMLPGEFYLEWMRLFDRSCDTPVICPEFCGTVADQIAPDPCASGYFFSTFQDTVPLPTIGGVYSVADGQIIRGYDQVRSNGRIGWVDSLGVLLPGFRAGFQQLLDGEWIDQTFEDDTTTTATGPFDAARWLSGPVYAQDQATVPNDEIRLYIEIEETGCILAGQTYEQSGIFGP